MALKEMASWADEVDLDSGTLPPATETTDAKGNKIVTEYRIKDDKKVKVVRTYRQEKQFVSKSIAKRKLWRKFGDSANDKDGPNTQTTMVSEDIYMQFISAREEDKNDPVMDTVKSEWIFQVSFSKNSKNSIPFQVNLLNVVIATPIISRSTVPSSTLPRTWKKCKKPNNQQLKIHLLRHLSQENTFHLKSETVRMQELD